jgi:N-dimethylarginine dimethylaminohydrolase
MISERAKIYSADNLTFTAKDISSRPEPKKVLMASPEFFDIIDVKNAHMEGQAGKLNKSLAIQQWNELKKVYESLVQKGILDSVHVIPGAKGCEDMVFAANQTFPWITTENKKVVVVSKMKHPSRQKEVPHFEKFFSQENYSLVHLSRTQLFEGMGDTIPHPGKRLLYGGYGHRSDISAYEEISEVLGVPIIPLELVDDRFYHLDTCFVPLNEESVMLYPEAFSKNGIEVIKKIFKNVLAIPLEEASGNFALNAHAIHNEKGKVAILQKGSQETVKVLKKSGFEVVELDTSEYMKSGGSVFCMKMMFY